MKANEVQIGDYVNYRGQIIKVTSLYDKGGSNEVGWSDKESVWVNGRCIEPIPLTPEILEKNGFVHYEEDEESFHDKDCVFIKQNLGGYGVCLDKIRTTSGTFHYVHELQHALRLCGIEKEVIL